MPLNLSQGSDDYTLSSSSKRKGGISPSNSQKVAIDLETIQRWFDASAAWFQTSFRSRVRLETLRPLPMFLGVDPSNMCFSPEAFGPPVKHLDKSTMEKIKSRVTLNTSFFLTNYVLVVLIVATVVALMHPAMLLFVAFVYGFWMLHHAWGTYEVHVFGLDLQRYLPPTVRSRALAALTAVVVIWKCLWPTITAFVISSVIISLHALLRDPKHIDLPDESHALSERHSGGHSNEDDDEEGGEMSDSGVLVERPSTAERRGDVI